MRPMHRVRLGRSPLTAALDAAALSSGGLGVSPEKFFRSYTAVGEF
jgi:hypothetical protein